MVGVDPTLALLLLFLLLLGHILQLLMLMQLLGHNIQLLMLMQLLGHSLQLAHQSSLLLAHTCLPNPRYSRQKKTPWASAWGPQLEGTTC